MNEIDIERSIIKLQEQRSEITEQIRKKHLEISDINSKLKIKTYKHKTNNLTQLRNSLKQDLFNLNTAASDLKIMIRKKRVTMEEFKLVKVETPNNLKDQIMIERDFYRQFASDKTRVSSMRLMASQFSEKLDNLLKIASQ